MSQTTAPGIAGKAGGLWPRAGFVASAITTFCCLGLSAAVSLASSVGATFLTRDATLQPLLAVSLAVTVAGSAWTYRRHRNLAPLVLSVAASLLVYAALYGPLDAGIGVTQAAGGHGPHHAEHDATAATAATAGAHGGISATALVWVGLAVLLAAQLWDARRARRCTIAGPPVVPSGGVA